MAEPEKTAPATPPPGPPSPSPEIAAKMDFAISEIEYTTDLFNRLTHTCFKKCIDKRYREAELYIGENSCIDRCVSKYWQVRNHVGQFLASGGPQT